MPRRLPDESMLVPGVKSAVYLFTRWWLLVPGLIGTFAFGWWLQQTAAANGKTLGADLFWIAPLVGFGFGVVLGLPGFFVARAMRPKAAPFAPAEGESELRRVKANHFLGMEGRGGQLVLTDRRLVFEPHRFNIQLDGTEVPLAAVEAVAWVRITGQGGTEMATVLQVVTGGRTERFVVPGAEAIAELVERSREEAVAA